MNKKILFIFMLTLVVIFNACTDKKDDKLTETFKTINYYDTHIKERDARREKCAALKSMSKIIRIDCDNAYRSFVKQTGGTTSNFDGIFK